MSRKTVRPPGWLVRALVPLIVTLTWSCSGQQQEDEQLEVQNENSDSGGNYQNQEGNAPGQDQNSGNYQDQEGQGSDNYANEQGGEEGNNYAAEGGEETGTGEEEDLQEIIQEMNGEQTASADAGMADAPMVGQADAGAAGGAGYAGGGAAPMDAGAPMSAGPAIPFQPGGSPAGPSLPEMGSKMPYVVQSGDTLAKISAKVYGDGGRWNEMASLSGLSNPSRIFPGDLVYYTLDEQSMAFATAYESVPKMEEQVQPGDTLATIAQRVYGSSKNWRAIWRQNDRINNPDVVPPGSTVYYIQESTLNAAIQTAKQQLAAVKSLEKQSPVKAVQISAVPQDAPSDELAKQVSPEQIDHMLDIVVNAMNAMQASLEANETPVRA